MSLCCSTESTMPGAHDQVDFGRRRLPGLLGAEGVDLAHQPAVLVVERDGVAQLVVGDRLAAQRSEIVAQLGQFLDVVVAADLVAIVLRHVEIARIDLRKHDLPHAGEVADHVADRGEQHAVDEIEPAGDAEFDRRARDAADVALVIGVAVDHLQLVAAADDAERQHVAGMDDLARNVDRHVADHLATRFRRLPLARRIEVQIFEQPRRMRDDFRGGGHYQQCSHFAGRLARKACRPSSASRLFISSSR